MDLGVQEPEDFLAVLQSGEALRRQSMPNG